MQVGYYNHGMTKDELLEKLYVDTKDRIFFALDGGTDYYKDDNRIGRVELALHRYFEKYEDITGKKPTHSFIIRVRDNDTKRIIRSNVLLKKQNMLLKQRLVLDDERHGIMNRLRFWRR